MRYHGRVAIDRKYSGLALNAGEGERIARAMNGRDIAFLGNHGGVVCGSRIDYAYDDLYYLERACATEVLARSTGRPLQPVDPVLAAREASQTQSERLQSELFFTALTRTLCEPAQREIGGIAVQNSQAKTFRQRHVVALKFVPMFANADGTFVIWCKKPRPAYSADAKRHATRESLPSFRTTMNS